MFRFKNQHRIFRLPWQAYLMGIPFWLLITSACIAGTKINIDSQQYTISGERTDDIFQDMVRQVDIDPNGKRYSSYTRWFIDWQIRISENDEGDCQIDDLDLILTIKQRLPRFLPQTDNSTRLIEAWQNYERALTKHENQHRDLAIAALDRIEQAVYRQLTAPDCETLDARTIERVDAIIQDLKRLQQAYDRRTENGKTEGVILPQSLSDRADADD